MYKGGMVDGLLIDTTSAPPNCPACTEAKLDIMPFPKKSNMRTSVPGLLIHTDVWEKAPKTLINGNLYYITLVDDYSHRCIVQFMKTKDETFRHLKNFVSWLKNQYGIKLKAIQCDNGGEYSSDIVKA